MDTQISESFKEAMINKNYYQHVFQKKRSKFALIQLRFV